MSTSRVGLGRLAEICAARYLERNGYRIICRNYRSRRGEIDIIARNGSYLVFVEVRSKSSNRFGSPAESVTQAKQHKLRLTAEKYMQENNLEDVDCRFDLVEVDGSGDVLRVAGVIENAF